jgi:hypothetical protein
VSRQRGEEAHPVKEAFFRLPSGRYAIGRTVYSGTDAMGRDGNYLAHHLVIEEADLRAAGGDPFAVLDAAGLAEAGGPLVAQALPAVTLAVSTIGTGPALTPQPPLPILGEGELLAALVSSVLNAGGTTGLLIGAEAATRDAIRAVFAALALDERLRLTFSTHFAASDHLRPLFTLVSVRTRTEAPSRLEQYRAVDLGAGKYPQVAPGSIYEAWLAASLRQGCWEGIIAVNTALNALRDERPEAAGELPPPGERACEVLWEQVPDAVTRALPGDARRVREFLSRLPSPRPLADTLLKEQSPSKLLGENGDAEEIASCLEALRTAASPRAWRRWVKRWEKEPLLASVKQASGPWWRRWRDKART